MNLNNKIYDMYRLRESDQMKVHQGAATGVWEVDEKLLLLCAKLFSHKDEVSSIETGLGFSTAVFANFGWNHTAITPSQEEIQKFREWAGRHKIIKSRILDLRQNYSFVELPNLLNENKKFDLALIDGNHSLPHAIVDFFYISQMLNVGGYLIIDDINLYGPGVLHSYILEKRYWSLVESSGKWSVFNLNSECRIVDEDWET